MKRIIIFILILSLLVSSSCTQKAEEDGVADVDPQSVQSDIQPDETQADTQSEIESSSADKAEQKSDTPTVESCVSGKTQYGKTDAENKASQSEEKETTADKQTSEKTNVGGSYPKADTEQGQKDTDEKAEQTPESSHSRLLTKEDLAPENDRLAAPASSFKYISTYEIKYTDFEDEICITKFTGNAKNVIIPNYIDGLPVTALLDQSFSESQIESVVIPENVTFISYRAFSGCSSLKSITIKSKLLHIGSEAFRGCTSLECLILPEGVVETGGLLFNYTEGLKELQIPSTLLKCGASAFGCSTLQSVKIAQGLKELNGSFMFSGCALLETLVIPSSVKKMSCNALADCSGLKSLCFEGDAPEIVFDESNDTPIIGTYHMDFSGTEPGDLVFVFSKELTIYYKNGTKGWDDTPLRKYYNLKEY